jgi:hypothetical protein
MGRPGCGQSACSGLAFIHRSLCTSVYCGIHNLFIGRRTLTISMGHSPLCYIRSSGFCFLHHVLCQPDPETVGEISGALEANPENEVKEFWGNTTKWLTRGFWIFAIMWLIIVPVLYFIMHRFIIGSGAPATVPGSVPSHPHMMFDIAFVMSPIIAYFMGGATPVAVVGLGSVVHYLSHSMDLKDGFILKGTKGILKPFNRLFWMTFCTVALPLLLIGMVAVTLNYADASSTLPLRMVDIIPLGLALLIFILTIIVPQMHMNGFLQKEKRQAIQNIQEQIDKSIQLPDGASQEEILTHTHNLQSLAYLEKKVDMFNPTIVDVKFIFQLLAVLTTILSAVLTIRTFLNLFIKT